MDRAVLATAAILFLCATSATLAIGFGDPRADYLYEFVVFLLAFAWCLANRDSGMKPIPSLALAAILAWGFLQLALGVTVYRFATVQSSLRSAALAATAWIACQAFRSRRLEAEFLRAFAWLGMLIAVTSVLAYFTSPGKILWTFDAPYPDIWGPFLSRNNFAQFLELGIPVALWLGFRESGRTLYTIFGAMMLAAGLASASRAGSTILVLETLAVLWIYRRSSGAPKMALWLLLATVSLTAILGAGHLLERLAEPDPYQGRREIADSTLQMIRSRPWTGFGLGSFPSVYPAYAVTDLEHSVEHAHNDWLEWASEGGIPYAFVWMGLALWVVRPAVRSVWGIGVLGSFLHGLVDYPFARLGIAAWIFVFLGLLARTEVREVRRQIH